MGSRALNSGNQLTQTPSFDSDTSGDYIVGLHNLEKWSLNLVTLSTAKYAIKYGCPRGVSHKKYFRHCCEGRCAPQPNKGILSVSGDSVPCVDRGGGECSQPGKVTFKEENEGSFEGIRGDRGSLEMKEWTGTRCKNGFPSWQESSTGSNSPKAESRT